MNAEEARATMAAIQLDRSIKEMKEIQSLIGRAARDGLAGCRYFGRLLESTRMELLKGGFRIAENPDGPTETATDITWA